MSSNSELPRLVDRNSCPWLHLFRAGGLACGWPQLAISFVAVIVYLTGLLLLRWSFPAASVPNDIRLRPMQLVLIEQHKEWKGTTTPRWPENPTVDIFNVLTLPWLSLRVPFKQLVFEASVFNGQSPSRLASLLTLAWAVAVWSFFGTAMCRAVAVQIATDRGESLPHSWRYSWSRWLSAMGAPSIPALAILLVALGLVLAAWFGRLPLIGSVLLTVVSPLLFVVGVVGAFFALVIVIGWPLMVAALAIEDCDAFGALSRTYSFLTGRPTYAVWNAGLSAVSGGILVALSGGLCMAGLVFLSQFLLGHIGTVERWATVMYGAHLTARLLLASFGTSLFWSLVTLNYLLLRQAVDRKPFEDIASGVDETQRRGELPIVGIPATDVSQEIRDRHLPVSDAEAVSPATPN